MFFLFFPQCLRRVWIRSTNHFNTQQIYCIFFFSSPSLLHIIYFFYGAFNVCTHWWFICLSLVKAEEHQRLRKCEAEQEEEDKRAEIYNHVMSDFLCEAREQAESIHGPKRPLASRYKGMTPDQIRGIRSEQMRQMEDREVTEGLSLLDKRGRLCVCWHTNFCYSFFYYRRRGKISNERTKSGNAWLSQMQFQLRSISVNWIVEERKTHQFCLSLFISLLFGCKYSRVHPLLSIRVNI